MSSPTRAAVVLGAGISGLAAAWRLLRADWSVTLLESDNRVGGVIRSERLDGYLLERGPNSFMSGDEIMELVAEIGLTDRAIVRPMKEHDRFVTGIRESRLLKVPTGPLGLLTTPILSASEKIAVGKGLLRRVPPLTQDVALGRFFRDRFGDAPVDALLRPFVSGIYAADADRISLEATFPKLYEAATKHERFLDMAKAMKPVRKPGAVRKPRALVSFPDGLEEFTGRLAEAIRAAGGDIRLGTTARLEKGTSRRWAVVAGEARLEADAVIVAMPAEATAAFLSPVAPNLATLVAGIEYAPLTIVYAGLDEESLADRRNGFGFLNARRCETPQEAPERIDSLGMIWSDRLFPGRAPAGQRLCTCFFGGEKEPEKNTLEEAAYRPLVAKDLDLLLNRRQGRPPLRFFAVYRWKKALPIFRVGHAARVRQASAELPAGIHVLGNFFGRVSMPDRVKTAAELVASLTGR